MAILAIVAVVGAMVWKGRSDSKHQIAPLGSNSADPTLAIPRVEVLKPGEGGIQRRTVQPGSVHSFESVELYGMVSGYLKSQSVDIGSRVQRGDILAEIDVPRERQVVVEASALLEQSKAQALQMEAKVKAMEAERATSAATMAQTESDIDRFVANRRLAESQLTRVRGLYERSAIEKRLVDEQERELEAAVVAERTGRLAVLTARARSLGAEAKVDQARADVAEAKAAVGVAEARAAMSRVDVDYARIVAPFDGVVTHRGFHPGAFIRSAADGNQAPLLTISRTDLMRVVVRVPDRDVTLADPGDPAVVTIDGLNGREFLGTVARIGESEDSATRTMRIEIDLANPDDLLREGMYGRARIALEPPSATRLTLPTGCILDRTGKGEGTVQVVRAGKVERIKVDLGNDNGSLVEVETGLKADDQVIIRSSTPVDPGMKVVTEAAR